MYLLLSCLVDFVTLRSVLFFNFNFNLLLIVPLCLLCFQSIVDFVTLLLSAG